MFVIKNGGPPILGRDFLKEFDFNFGFLNHANSGNNNLTRLISKYSTLFDNTLGKYTYKQIHLEIKDDAKAKFIY